MYIFAVALQDGVWDDAASYAPERARPDAVRLWRKVRTEEDAGWNRRFTEPAPLDKDHGARVTVTYRDGSVLENAIAVARVPEHIDRVTLACDLKRRAPNRMERGGSCPAAVPVARPAAL